MTNAGAAGYTKLSETAFTGERLFGVLVGGLCAPPIGLAGSHAAVPIFAPTPGAFNASPEAMAEALWVSALAALSIVLVWGLLAIGRQTRGLWPRSLLALGWSMTIVLLAFLLDAYDGRFDADVFRPQFVLVAFMMWMLSVPTAFALGSLALVATRCASSQSVAGFVVSGTIIALVVSFLFPGAPFYVGPDGIVGALGFWLPTGVFAMGCCGAASGTRWV